MRASTTTAALLTAGLLTGALAGPAGAAEQTTLQLSGAAATQLTSQKARFSAAGGATASAKRVALPVRRVAVKGSTATISHRGSLTLRVAKRSVRLTDPQLVVGTSSRLTAKIGARRYTVATLFTNQRVRKVTAGGAALDRAPATLAPAVAKQLRTRLKLRRTPKGRLGTISVAAGGVTLSDGPSPSQPAPAAPVTPVVPDLVVPPVPSVPDPDPTPIDPDPPTPIDPGDPESNPYYPVADDQVCPTTTNGLSTGSAPATLPAAPGGATTVTAGGAAWGFSALLRESPNFIAYNPGDGGASYVARTIGGVACHEPYRMFADGARQGANDRMELPVDDGWYDASTGRAAVRLAGGFRLGYHIGGWQSHAASYPAPTYYRGLWASFADALVTIDGASGTIEAYSEAAGHTDWRHVPLARRALGSLDLSGVVPDTSISGQVTWHDVPVTLTAAGAPLGVGYYSAGDALDPITITVRTAD